MQLIAGSKEGPPPPKPERPTFYPTVVPSGEAGIRLLAATLGTANQTEADDEHGPGGRLPRRHRSQISARCAAE